MDGVDLPALVRKGGEGDVDGDVALLLLGIGVEDARRVIHFAQARGRADRVQERFDEARLAGAAVTDDDDVADLVRLDRRHSWTLPVRGVVASIRADVRPFEVESDQATGGCGGRP